MGKTQERAARVMADTDLLADLNKVRKVRADVENKDKKDKKEADDK